MIKFLLLCSGLLLFACTPAPRYGSGNNTRGKSIYSTNSRKKVDTGLKLNIKYNWVASFYADDFHGKQTANGENFDMNALTCAHKTLPFNTILRVTNPDNNQQVTVRVNDRGPFIAGRDLDLSLGAAKKIGLLTEGVKALKVEILDLPVVD